ncbi:hypothetical protein [Oscillospiraceae bacterium]|nr:hypothetical protein [Oscillospiraceae bacterium]
MGGVIYTDTETDAGACSSFDAAHTGAGGTKSRYRAYDLETRYLDEPEFQTAYQEAVTKLLEEASVQAKQGLSPALSCLREIVEDRKTAATARIQAARSLLEYGLRLTETVDVMKQLNELEQWRDKVDGND